MPIVIFKKKCLGYKVGQRVNLNPTLYEVLTAKGYVEDPQPEPAEIHDKMIRPKRKKK
jgi:hypothetical protein